MKFIGSLKTNMGAIDSVSEVKEEIIEFFKMTFTKSGFDRAMLEGVTFRTLSQSNVKSLEDPFSDQDIKEVVWGCEGFKSHGPDGYNFVFIKNCWHVLKEDITIFVKDFHCKETLSKAITSSFLTLILEKLNPQGLEVYKTIFLVGFLYKILAKLLDFRFKKLIGFLISPCQSSFVPCWKLLDGVLIENEILDLASRTKHDCLMFKVDFEKVYDRVSWDFLMYMMNKMGLSRLCMIWMKTCILTSHMSILVNGSPTL